MKKVDKLFEEICNLNLLEANYLMRKISEKFGNFSSSFKNENNDSIKKFNVELLSFGENKISTIRMVKEILNLDLMKSKNIVDKLPKVILNNLDKKKAEEIVKKFSSIGCDVQLK
ncbi:ribosomal protein bL12 [Candidatus Vidania fulgoroideorum]